MEIIDITQMPVDGANSGCPERDVDSMESEGNPCCQYCDRQLAVDTDVHLFTADHGDTYALCEECFGIGVRLCNYSYRFYKPEALVTLVGSPEIGNNIRVHCSETDIIDTFRRVSDPRKYLEMVSIEPDGVGYCVTKFSC